MLDVKILRNEYARVEEALTKRGKSLDLIAGFTEMDAKRRELLQESETLKSRRNTVSAEVARLKKNRENADDLIVEMREVSDRIKAMDEEVRELEVKINDLTMAIPNILTKAYLLELLKTTMLRFVVGKSQSHLLLHQKHTGKLHRISIFLILKRLPK